MALRLSAELNSHHHHRGTHLNQDAEMARKMQDAFDEERRAKVEENKKNDYFDVLSEHRTNIENFLNKHWKEQMGKIIEIKENPHSLPGTPQYNRFVEEWQKVADQTVKCVFHGTPEANIDAICLGGLDPSRRGKNGQAHGAGEYFADEPAICLAYCKGGNKMLVFAVLLDRSGFTANKVTVINNTAHQLPLFIVTFQNPMGLVRPAEGWKVGVASMAGIELVLNPMVCKWPLFSTRELLEHVFFHASLVRAFVFPRV